ncbi:MAG: hypothetical protein AB8H03_23760 [Saprospiraceae bacterium]
MKKLLLLSFLCFFIFSQNLTATPVDIKKKDTPTEVTIQPKKNKKRKKKFFARMAEKIMKRRVGKMIKKYRLSPVECDQIVLNSGEELDVKIIKVGEERIRYKSCDFQNGPTRSIRIEDIFLIKYADGTKEVFTDVDALKKNQKVANNFSYQEEKILKQYWTIGFLLGLLLGIFSLLVILIALKGEKRKRAFRGALAGMLSILLFFTTLILLTFPFI